MIGKLTAEHVTIRLVFGAQSIPVIRSPCWSRLSKSVQSFTLDSYLYIWTSLLFGITAISKYIKKIEEKFSYNKID